MADRIRIELDVAKKTAKEVRIGGSPIGWNNTPVNIEFGVLQDGAIRTIVDFSSIAVAIKPATRRGQPLVYKEIASADFSAITLAEWEAGVLYHGVAELAAQDMTMDLGANPSKAFWLAFYGTLLDGGEPVMLGGCPLTVQESGINLDGNVATSGANLISPGSVYDGSGNFTLAVDADSLYTYVQGANDDTLVNDTQTLTTDGEFTAVGASVTLTGTIGQSVTAIVRFPLVFSASQTIALVSENAIGTTNEAGKTATFISPDGLRGVEIGMGNDGNVLMRIFDV